MGTNAIGSEAIILGREQDLQPRSICQLPPTQSGQDRENQSGSHPGDSIFGARVLYEPPGACNGKTKWSTTLLSRSNVPNESDWGPVNSFVRSSVSHCTCFLCFRRVRMTRWHQQSATFGRDVGYSDIIVHATTINNHNPYRAIYLWS